MTEIKRAISEMYTLMEVFAKFGASDSEPRGIFRDILEDVLEGREPHVPQTAEGWELFSDMYGAEQIALQLHDKARLVEFIGNANAREMREAMSLYFGSR